MANEDTKKNLTESLFEAISAVKGTRYIKEADEDEDEKKYKDDEEGGEEGGEDIDLPPIDDEEGIPGDEELPPLGDEEGAGEEDLETLDELPGDDLSLEDDSDIPSDFAGELGDEGELGAEGEFPSDEESPEDLLADEPPSEMDGGPFEETPGEEGLEKSSDVKEFVTNQLIDFPVEDIEFEEQEGAKYIDAKFGDKAVSFCLYTSEDGQPLFAILYDNEVHRIELAPEAVTGDGMVRDEFMPVDWIRDHLSRIVDVAPEFESRRLKKLTANCNETVKVTVKTTKFSEKSGITRKPMPMKNPKAMGKTKVNSGPTRPAPHKQAALGGDKIKPATKSGGKVVMK